MFSKTCQYAIQGTIYVALHGSNKHPIGLAATAKAQKIPNHFLGKIMQQLVRKHILKSIKGPNGGFFLAKPPEKIRLIDIYDVFDGIENLEKCVMGFDTCSGIRPCPLHNSYMPVKEGIFKLLEEKTIKDFVDDVQAKRSYVSYFGWPAD